MLKWICLEIIANQVKIVHVFNGHGGHLVRAVALAMPRVRSPIPAGIFYKFGC
jgi:hypothetical protein